MPEVIVLFTMGWSLGMLTFWEFQKGFVYARGKTKIKKTECPRSFQLLIILQILASACLIFLSIVAFVRYLK